MNNNWYQFSNLKLMPVHERMKVKPTQQSSKMCGMEFRKEDLSPSEKDWDRNRGFDSRVHQWWTQILFHLCILSKQNFKWAKVDIELYKDYANDEDLQNMAINIRHIIKTTNIDWAKGSEGGEFRIYALYENGDEIWIPQSISLNI